MTNSNPFAPPTAEVADIEAPVSGTLASRGRRFLAVLIDGVLQLAIVWLASKVLPWPEASEGKLLFLFVLNTVAGMALFLLLHAWLLLRHGQTIGKRLLSLRIVRRDGAQLGAGGLLLRYGPWFLLGAIPFLGAVYSLVDALLIFRDSRQCLHDSIAQTIVVNT